MNYFFKEHLLYIISVSTPMATRLVIDRIDAVVNCTPIRVKIKSKLTNLMIKSRIEGYNGK